ncbi:MAG: transporter substrate-binding domain-containing protein, partial [Kordiimonas sp.]
TVKRMGHDVTKALTASSLADGFDMLDSGRVAGFVAIDNDVKYLIAQDPRYDGYSVSSTFSVNVGSDLVVCRQTKTTDHFMKFLNGKIAEMTADGSIAAIMHDALVAVRAAR